MDVMSMVVTGNLPANHNGLGNDVQEAIDYDDAIAASTLVGSTHLSYDGKIKFEQMNVANTQARIALHDVNSGDFTQPAPVMTFNSNNALTVRDPKTDFFKELDEMITAVEDHKFYPDSSDGHIRNIGMENAITMLDDLQEHISRVHSTVGAQSNALTTSLERTEMLKISTMTLRSSVIDTDLAEASLKLTQLTLNYEAMLSTVGRVSKLSLVNYL
jgi:flagellar hook-associated protein 3 FlgL